MLQRLRRMDPLLNLAALALLAVSVCFIYSAAFEKASGLSKPFYEKQMLWALAGAGLFLILFWVHYREWISLSPILYLLGVAFLLLVLFAGKTKMGAQRWLPIGGFAFQPSEFSKMTLILALAAYWNRFYDSRKSLAAFFGALLVMCVPMLLILKQPDLGTAMIYVPIFFAVCYVMEVPLKYLLGLAAAGAAACPFLWQFLKEYQKNRILVFLDPNRDPLGSGYHLIQSKIAIGSGGVWGKGWLAGTQNQLNFLPERHTDFIFSVLGEEWGFLRSLFVVALYFMVVTGALHVANQSQDRAGRAVAAGVAALFLAHVFVNIGMTIGIMPITGVPLPFLSYGGTSLLTMLGALALLQNIYSRRFYF